jgi:hypothetical protein
MFKKLALAAGLYWLWSRSVGGGAVSGVVPRFTLMVFKRSHLDPGWPQALRALGCGINVKIADGAKRMFAGGGAAELAQQARAAGVYVEGWGYHYLRTSAAAVEEARAAAEAALAHKVAIYWVDAEKEWAGVEGEPRTTNPPAAALAFLAEFRRLAPGVRLVWASYSFPRTSAKTGGRPLTTDEVLKACDASAPQCYGTDRQTIRDKVADRAKRAERLGVPFWPIIGSGRIDAQGRVWGWTVDVLAWLKSGTHRIGRVCVWYGAGSAPMLTEKNKVNPPLSNLLAQGGTAKIS